MNDFIAMDYEVFGNELFGNIPEDLYIAHKIDNTNRLFYGGNRGDYTSTLTIDENSKMMVIDVTSCTTVYHCTHHGGGSCDHCSKCETTTCTTNSIPIFISEGTDFPTGNDIPPGDGGGIGIGDGEVPSGPGPKPPRDPCTKTGIFYRMMPGCGGTDIPELLDDPCEITKVFTTAADNLLQNPTVQTQMDGVLKGKITATNEFAMKIGDIGNSSYSYSNLVEGTVSSGDLNDAILPSGVYIADGHSHAGGQGNPSGGDLYGFLEKILTNPGLKYRFVYGNNSGSPEIYLLVLNDKTVISDFLSQYPRSENYDPETHNIKEGSKLGLEFFKAYKHNSEGRSENTSGENYANGAVAMAYILDKLNTGVTIAHQDNSGRFKKINASVAEITIPYSGGKKKEGVKVSKCP